MLKTEKKQLPQRQDHIRMLYQKYGALLLGYISGVVNNRQESEEYLVAILGRFAIDFPDHIRNGDVSWLQLLQYSRSILPQLQSANPRNANHSRGNEVATKYNDEQLNLLSSREKEIFCSIYYHGKSICDLAKSLQESESRIRSEFKLSFDKIRSARGN